MSDTSISYRSELIRKTIHLLAMVLPIGMLVLDRRPALAVLASLSALALTTEFARTRSAAVQRTVDGLVGWMMRAEEKPPLGQIRLSGATWVLISALVLLVFFPARLASLALTVFMVGDAAAALVGRRFGKHRWGNGQKTIEGTVGFVVAGSVVGLFFTEPAIWFGPAAALMAGAFELLPGPLNDNLQAPFLTAFALALAESLVLGLPFSFLPGAG
jgi:dolichol kinase